MVPASGTAHTPITNTGGYPLIISEVNFLNSDSDFSVSSSLPFEVAPFSTDSLEFTFTPSSAFLISDSVYLSTNDPDAEMVELAISGYGQMAEISLSHQTLTFPTIHSDQTLDQMIIVSNTGNGDLTVNAVSSSSGYFSIEGGPWFAPVGGKDTIVVTFTPTYVGDYSSILTISSDDPLNPTKSVDIIATAVTPTVVFIPLDSPTIQGGIELAE